jgi:two-component system sensor histidine kinase/response regulator
VNERCDSTSSQILAAWLVAGPSAGRDRSSSDETRQAAVRFQSLVNLLPLNVLIKDAQGRRVYANESYLESHQIALADILGKTDLDLFPEEVANKYREDDQLVLSTGDVLRGMEERSLRNGRRVWIERIKGPVRSAEGDIVGIYVLFWDVSQKVQDEAALNLERDLLNSLMDNIPDAIYFKDRESRFLRVSRAQSDRFGLACPDDAIGKTDADIFTPEHAQEALRDEQRIMESGEPLVAQVEKETWTDRADSWVSTTKMPLRDKSGRIAGTFGISRDVTQLMRMQDELSKARDAAESASRTKGEFLANMSHEIRTPMNGIMGMTELLLNTDLTSEQRDYLRLVQSSADALLSVLNDILDFSKIEAGKLDLDHSPFQLRDTLGITLHALAARAAKKGLELAVHIFPDVPDRLVGDAGRLRQIVVNLVGNAIKFTEEGEVVVEVRRERDGDGVVTLQFSVSDTGIGISPDHQAKIFEAFTQADASTTREYGGTGLGLAISTQLVQLMGGRIWVTSHVGEGSTFHFVVEFGRAEGQEDRDAAKVETLFELPVLVVDDNRTNRIICEEMLTNWGMKPTVVAGGEEALQAFDRAVALGSPYQLALVDVMMPHMDGFELTRLLRERPAANDVTIILLTSADHPQHIARANELGIARSIVKPVTQSMLLDGITSAMGVARADQAPARSVLADRSESFLPRRVLLAEDGVVNRKVAVTLLEQRGHDVTAVENGQLAVDAFRAGEFDVILLDVQMPVLDGLAATAAIRQLESTAGGHIRIVAMTAHAMKGDRERCLGAGMDAYVSKPFRPHELFAEVERAPADGTLNASLLGTGSLLARTPPTIRDAVHRRMTFDRDEALKNVGGCQDMLTEMAVLLASECPKHFAEIEAAYAVADCDAVMRAAHTLKGSVSLFGAPRATAAARRLETMAREGNLGNFPEAWADLQQSVGELLEALRTSCQ